MLEYLKLLFTQPEAAEALSYIVLAIVGLVASVAIPILVRAVNRFTFIKIEEKHAKAIENGIRTWTENALNRGVRDANELAIEDLKSYLNTTYPDAMAFLHPTMTGLRNLAIRYYNR